MGTPTPEPEPCDATTLFGTFGEGTNPCLPRDHNKVQSSSSTVLLLLVIVIPIVFILIILLVVGLICCQRKQLYCFKPKKKKSNKRDGTTRTNGSGGSQHNGTTEERESRHSGGQASDTTDAKKRRKSRQTIEMSHGRHYQQDLRIQPYNGDDHPEDGGDGPGPAVDDMPRSNSYRTTLPPQHVLQMQGMVNELDLNNPEDQEFFEQQVLKQSRPTTPTSAGSRGANVMIIAGAEGNASSKKAKNNKKIKTTSTKSQSMSWRHHMTHVGD